MMEVMVTRSLLRTNNDLQCPEICEKASPKPGKIINMNNMEIEMVATSMWKNADGLTWSPSKPVLQENHKHRPHQCTRRLVELEI